MNVYKVTLECDHSYCSVQKAEAQRPQFVLGKNGDEAVAQAKKAFRLFNPSLQGLECVVTDVKIKEAPITAKGIVKTNDGNAAVVEFASNILRTYIRRDKDSVNDFNRHFIVGTEMYFNTEYQSRRIL